VFDPLGELARQALALARLAPDLDRPDHGDQHDEDRQ
jgi:hypothetical protein